MESNALISKVFYSYINRYETNLLGVISMKYQEEWLNKETGKYKCPECDKEFSKFGIGNHIWRTHGEGKDFKPMQGKTSFKKGKTNCEIYGKDRYLEINEKISKGVTKTHPRLKLTEEHKNKISISRKRFLVENPDQVPYLLNHYSKGPSYPEIYFEELFENEGIGLLPEFQVSIYSLDFACPERKFYLEVDGEQHFVDERVIESDVRRNEFLSELGWKGMRIRWSKWQKTKISEKTKIIENIKQILGSKH